MPRSKRSDYIPVNQILGTQPNLGPFPGDQVIYWAGFLVLVFVLRTFLRLSWVNAGLLFFWLCGTWWVLNGEHSWRYKSKVHPRVPFWTRGVARYQKLLED